MPVTAQYLGNSDGQTRDSSGNRRNLIYNYPVSNPPIKKAIGEGDHWLGGWSSASQFSTEDFYSFSTLSKPSNTSWVIEFLFLSSDNSSTSTPINFDTVTDTETNANERWLYVYNTSGNDSLGLDYTDTSGSGAVLNGSIITDDEITHLIRIEGDSVTGVSIFVDGKLSGHSDIPVDFGIGQFPFAADPVYSSIMAFGVGEGTYTFVDDLKIMSESRILAEWKGNSTPGRLVASVGENLIQFGSPQWQPNNYPASDSWIGSWGADESDMGSEFSFPLSSKPQMQSGSIVFYMKWDASFFNGFNIYNLEDVFTNHKFNIANRFEGEVNEGKKSFFIGYTDINGLEISSIFYCDTVDAFDGAAHKIAITWNGSTLSAYVDDVAASFYDYDGSNQSASLVNPDFSIFNDPTSCFDGDFASFLGSFAYFSDGNIYLGDFTVTSQVYTPALNPSQIIARWQGNNGQIQDSIGGNTLMATDGHPGNPGNNNAPEGDRWLGSWDGTIKRDTNGEFDALLVPLTARPHNDEGRISFWFQSRVNNSDEYVDMYPFDFETYNPFTEQSQFFYIELNGYPNNNYFYVSYSDGIGNSGDFFTNNVSTLFDGNPHQLWFTWNRSDSMIQLWIDGVIVTLTNVSTPTFGDDTFAFSSDGFNLIGGVGDFNTNKYQYFIDDFTISPKYEKPMDLIDTTNLIARWQGNS